MSVAVSVSGPLRISVVLPVLDEAARIGERLSELARLAFHESSLWTAAAAIRHRPSRGGFPASCSSRLHAGEPARMNEGGDVRPGDVLLFLHLMSPFRRRCLVHARRARTPWNCGRRFFEPGQSLTESGQNRGGAPSCTWRISARAIPVP